MSNIPSLRVREARFRSQTNSSDQNKMVEETLFDLSNLFNLMNEQETLLADVKETLTVDNKYQELRLATLTSRVADLEAALQAAQQDGGKYKTIIRLQDIYIDESTPIQEQAQIDSFHRIVTLPVNGKSQSKVYLYDEQADEIFLPSTFSATVTPVANGTTIIDNDIKFAFNGDNADVWRRRVSFPMDDETDVVTCKVTIRLPDNIISNRDINTITVHPFPVGSMTLRNIEFSNGDGWNLIPGWQVEDGPVGVDELGNTKFSFESTEMTLVALTFEQRTFVIEGQKKVFYMGAQEIGISYSDYKSSVGRFVAKVELPGNSQSKLIKSIKPVFVNELALSDKSEFKPSLFSYSIYKVNDDGTLQYTRDVLPIMVDSQRVVIRGNLYADNKEGNVPALGSIEVTYEDLT